MQEMLWTDLLAFDLDDPLDPGGVRLDPERPTCAANALRLYHALVARHPRWANRRMARRLVERRLASWSGSATRTPSPRTPSPTPKIVPTPPTAPETAGTSAAAKLERPGPPQPKNDVAETSTAPPIGRRDQALLRTECAGVFLLLRAAIDLRLASHCRHHAFPTTDGADPWSDALLHLTTAWAGPEIAWAGDRLDPALAWLAELEGHPRLDEARPWKAAPASARRGFEDALAELALARRLVRRDDRLAVFSTDSRVVAQVGDRALFVARRPTKPHQLHRRLSIWGERWRRLTGEVGPIRLDGELLGRDEVLFQGIGPRGEPVFEAADAGASQHHQRAAELLGPALEALGEDAPNPSPLPPLHRATLRLAAALTLRGWAQWLRGFDTASLPFLLEQLIRRPGEIRIDSSEILVRLHPGPVDVVAELAGYFEPLGPIDWLGGRTLRFEVRKTEDSQGDDR